MEPPNLLVCTTNAHKSAEIQRILGHVPYKIVTPVDAGLSITVIEDGKNYQENAEKKALAFAKTSGLLSIADDSGIEIAAMGGRPGIRSARYGGENASDQDRVRLVLKELIEVPWERRNCRYIAVISLASPNGQVHSFEGSYAGVIALKPEGSNGFGYDPIFYSNDHAMTMSQMSEELKDHISHRGNAVRLAASFLRTNPSI